MAGPVPADERAFAGEPGDEMTAGKSSRASNEGRTG
jgi:hypothetical protein